MNSHDDRQNDESRRKFMAAALAAAALSAAGGAGLALRQGQSAAPEIVTAPAVSTAPAITNPVNSAQQDLLARLAAAQAENVRLQAQVDGLNRRLAAAESGRTAASDETTILRDELAHAQEQVGLLAGLVTLYDQLEDIDLSDTLMNGLTALATRFNQLGENLPGLDDAVAAGEFALATFEGDIPALENGRAWFSEHISQLSWRWQTLEVILREITEALGDSLALLQSWFDRLLGWVPFEFGERTRRGLNALFDLVQTSPQTIERGQTELLSVMDQWLKPEAGQKTAAVHNRLIRPLRDQLLGTAVKTSQGVKETRETFQLELVTKTAANLADRAEILQLIERYRQEHQI